MAIVQIDYFFEFQHFIFKILTWGVLSYILIGVCIVFMFLTLVFILKDYRIIKYVLREKFRFIKNYFYMFSLQKAHFIKSYIKALYNEANKKRLYTIFFGVLIIIGILLYIFLQYIKKKG